MLEKNRRKKVKKTIFYSQEYRDQKFGGKNARNNFSRNTQMVRSKMLVKITENMCEQPFLLYSHKHRYQKMGEKKRETIFPEIHEYVRGKMLGRKSSQKFSKKKILYSFE